MKDLHWDADKNTLHEALGISEERNKKLRFLYDSELHKLNAPKENGKAGTTGAEILTQVLPFSETTEECILLSFLAGGYVGKKRSEMEAEHPLLSLLKELR